MPTQILDMERSSPQSQQIDTALRHSEARFSEIAASVPGVIYQFLKHPDGSLAFPFVSPSCREILEVEAIEIEADVDVLLSMIHPEDLADFNHSIALSRETLQMWQWEGRFTLRSGRLIWIQGAAVPEPQENGDMLWNGLLMDITARKQAEEERMKRSQTTSQSYPVSVNVMQSNSDSAVVATQGASAFSVSGTGHASVQGVGIRTQQFLNSLLENLPVAVFVKEAEALRYVFWNKASTQLIGYSAQDVLGKSGYDLFPTEEVDAFIVQDRDVLESGQLLDVPEEHLHTPHRGQRIFRTKKIPILDEAGRPQYLLGITEDITERKQTEAALRESEERFRNLVESTHDLIWEIDENAIYTYVSPQIKDILGYDVEEVLGKTPFDFMSPEEACCIIEFMSNRVALQLPITNLESTNIHKDGYTIILEMSGVPFFDKAGNFKGYRGIDRDITKRKQTEEAIRQSKAQLEQALRQLQNTQAQLIQTEKMSSLGQLVAGVAHEINNPINFVYGNIKHARNYITDLFRLIALYQDVYPQPDLEIEAEIETIDLNFIIEDFPKLLDSMEVGAERIRGIVRSLRTFSRLDESAAKAVDLRQGLDSTLILLQSRLQPPLSSQTIQVVKDYSDLPLIKCYPGELNQVFMNLLNNAIDALEKRNRTEKFEAIRANPGIIRIRTEMNSPPNSIPWVVIRIVDNGIGMSEEARSRAFDPFFTTKSVGEGTGLGLAISYQIVVELHKGRLYCISSPGEGAEFVIEIPIQ